MDDVINKKAEEILNKARNFKQLLARRNQRARFVDYERFKLELHQNGIYGKEQILADILKV